MRSFKILSFFIFICFLFTISAATTGQLEKAKNGYSMNFQISENVAVYDVDQYGLRQPPPNIESYTQISIPGYTPSENIGKPELPFLTFRIAISDLNNAIDFEVLNAVETNIPLTNKVFPAQIPWPKNRSIYERPFSMDEAYYAGEGVRDPVVEEIERFTLQDVHFVDIRINPFSYNPKLNSLNYIKSFSLNIITPTHKKIKVAYSRSMDEHLRYLCKNYDAVVEQAPFRSKKEGNYLIITGPRWENGLSEFVEFRKLRFTVNMVTTGTTGTSSSAIESYIRSASPKPDYVLLVGDTDDIPSRSAGGKGQTDVYYASKSSNDHKPEKFVGRFSVANDVDLENIITKTIHMEENMNELAKRAIFLGGVDKNNGHIAERTHNNDIKNNMDPNGFESIKLYCNSTSVSKSQYTQPFNAGVLYNIYSAHGSSTSWGVGESGFRSITISDVNGFSNPVYPVTMGFACLTGSYHQSECFTEAHIRAKNASSVAIGATISTTWTPDERLQNGIMDAIYDNSNPQTDFGQALNAGKFANNSSQSTYMKVYNLMGDPAYSCVPVNTAPYVSISYPKKGEKLEQHSTVNVSWNTNVQENFKVELLKGGSVKETLGDNASGGSLVWKIPGNMATGDDYTIKTTSKGSSPVTHETGEFSITKEYIISTFPHLVDFDKLDSGSTVLDEKWEQTEGDDFDWLVLSGPTPSKEYGTTGPDGDHTSGTGKYIYVEASNPNNPGKKAAIKTCKFNFENVSQPQLTFYTHMFSDSQDIGELILDIEVDGNMNKDVLKLDGPDYGDKWIQQSVDLDKYKGKRVIFHFRATTGRTYAGDMCIDDFKISGSTSLTTPLALIKPFSLHINESRLTYFIPENGRESNALSINVFNIQGKIIKKLVQGKQKAGIHSIDLNSELRGIAQGMYMVQLTTGAYNHTIKMIKK